MRSFSAASPNHVTSGLITVKYTTCRMVLKQELYESETQKQRRIGKFVKMHNAEKIIIANLTIDFQARIMYNMYIENMQT